MRWEYFYMKIDRKNPAVVIGILLLLIAIPLTVWLALNRQFLGRRAAENEVTVNLVSATTSVGLAETFTVDVFVNAGAMKVSGATISLNTANAGILSILNVETESDEQNAQKPFTHRVYNAQSDPYTFTVLAKRPDASLPTGSIKVATITFQATGSGSGSISINKEKSEIVGIKTGSDLVNFGIAEGTVVSITTTGSLCRVDMCTPKANIRLVEQPRDDRKFNIQATWDDPVGTGISPTTLFFKVYRSQDQALTTPHQDSNLVATTLDNTIVDTNKSAGYDGTKTVYYDIDTYIVCPGETTPTPTQSSIPTATSIPATPTPAQ